MIDIIINIPNDTKKITVKKGEVLLDAIRSAGVHIDAPCNGNGICGKCKVKLLHGNVLEKSNHKLTEESRSQGNILACTCQVIEPITIDIPKESILNVSHIRVENNTDHFNDKYYHIKEQFQEIHGSTKHIERLDLIMEKPTLDDNISDITRLKKYICKSIQCDVIEINLNVLRKIPFILRQNDFKVMVLYTYMSKRSVKLLDILPYGKQKGFGVAVDVGTTSVAACLVNLEDGMILGEVSCANAQSKYGADVINRIIYATKGNGLQVLKDAVVKESINPLIMELCRSRGVRCEDIILFTASANTTMSHLMIGVYPDFLRKEPYIPAFTDTALFDISVDDVGLCINQNGIVIISPSVASYVGGDISAGVLASFMREKEGNSILIDLGTNGEIVFGNKDFLMTCACSAGPAFEGGEISCGMRAAPGAIEGIVINNDFIPHLEIIDSKKPHGICGSGIIDLISQLKKVELIDAKGKFRREAACRRVSFDQYGIGQFTVAYKEEYELDQDIYINEVDIDNFIRAKAAVYSATYVLLSSLGLDFDAIDEIKVAGGIGTHINIKNAINIGLFPDIDVTKYKFIGNSSLTGSYMSLINKNAKEFIDDTAQHMTYIELSVYPGYMDEFISASFIPHTDLHRFSSHNKHV
ncbi:MAG: corrinoid activation/regeneration protein AcsV [Eubacteriales bacterium]